MVPWCYFPKDYGYMVNKQFLHGNEIHWIQVESLTKEGEVTRATLTRSSQYSNTSVFGGDFSRLVLTVTLEVRKSLVQCCAVLSRVPPGPGSGSSLKARRGSSPRWRSSRLPRQQTPPPCWRSR